MSPSLAPPLQEHRNRRLRRLELTYALYRGDPIKALLISELARVLELATADRAAVIWLDLGLDWSVPHMHALLDVGDDTPRRTFPLEPLLEAQDLGPRILLDLPTGGPSVAPAGSLMAVSIGGDGHREWFVVAEGRAARLALSPVERELLASAGGRCAGVVLHRDLDRAGTGDPASGGRRGSSLAGWGVLGDAREDMDEEESHRVGFRLLGVRLIGSLVDDDAVFPPTTPERLKRLRAELDGRVALGDPEHALWRAVVASVEARDVDALSATVLALARHTARRGLLWSAAELSHLVYELATTTGEAARARDAAAVMARVYDRLSRGDPARAWRRVADGLAHALRGRSS